MANASLGPRPTGTVGCFGWNALRAWLGHLSIDRETSLRSPKSCLQARTPSHLDINQAAHLPASAERIARNVAQRFAWSKIATIVLRDVPEVGWAWGWFANGLEPRMFIEPMDLEHRRSGRIYLETADGQPAFEPAGNFCGIDLDRLRSVVEANHQRIERAWVTTMCRRGWLHLYWDRALRDLIRITGYASTPNERVHELPVRWSEIIGKREPELGDIAMDRANAVLILGAKEPRPFKIPMASVLWPTRTNATERPQPIGPRDLLARVCRRLPSDFEP